MVDAGGDGHTVDAHVLELPDGHIILIDTGLDRFTGSGLLSYLKERNIKRVNQVVITNPRRDHYGGMTALMRDLEGLNEVYFNLPSEAVCSGDGRSNGCDYGHIEAIRQAIRDAGIPLRKLGTDDVIHHDEQRDITLEVVYAGDGESDPVGDAAIEGSGVMLRLTYGPTTVLFAGELSRSVGRHLIDRHYFVRADILAASDPADERDHADGFLGEVDPDAIMVSTSTPIREMGPHQRLREYAARKDIPVYATTAHGHVVTTLMKDGFSVAARPIR